MKKEKLKITVFEMTVFGMLGALMYASKVIMSALPNIHLLGMLITAQTLVFRKKALYPIYIFVFLTGLINGFSAWWVPYLYIWTVLWAAVMLIPRGLSGRRLCILCCIICGLHGLLYGTLYAPFYAIVMHLDLAGALSWILAGLPFDAVHAVSNVICALLTIPVAKILKRAMRGNL